MKIDEVYQYFGSSTQMRSKIGLSHTNFVYWRKKGYIPIETQFRIQELTKGALKARFEDCGKD